MKHTITLILVLLHHLSIGQIEDPVQWKFDNKTGKKSGEVILVFTALIEDGWHIYAQEIPEGGPIATSFHIEEGANYQLTGAVVNKSELIAGYDNTFEMNIGWFEETAVFEQTVVLTGKEATVSGYLEFMVCNEMKCLPPKEVEFTIKVTAPVMQEKKPQPKETKPEPKVEEVQEEKNAVSPPIVVEEKKDTLSSAPEEVTSNEETTMDSLANTIDTELVAEEADTIKDLVEIETRRSLWATFVTGFLGGLAAFFMPCIFPMLPFTVGFFSKGTSTHKKAIGKSLIFGFSIVAIYVTLGLLVTVLFGADTLNELATNGVFNFFFFVLLVVFAASFLGAFEIVLPSKWVNKTDAQADKGGLVGVFFMAATLALVSFSCTGPIIGTLLVEAATSGGLLAPAIGMAGFAFALALPFTLFSAFPAWMKSLPKSGGWLNSVKVVLGFLELALALKFLSNVDLAYHWQWFDREVFLVLWVVIFGLLGLYLLGKVRFPHDSELAHISPVRLGLAIISLAFSLYLVPGLWGAPLKAVAAFLPPQHTQDFDLYTHSLGSTVGHNSEIKPKRKYDDLFHAPLNLQPFFDYEEGLAYAKKVGKPVMLDFTGHACVNCRKMESTIWPDEEVYELIDEEFVLIQLYVDDKTSLPEEEQFVSDYSGKKIRTIGNLWSEFQADRFNNNSQPYYVLLSPDGELLTKPVGAVYNAEKYAEYLRKGLLKYKE